MPLDVTPYLRPERATLLDLLRDLTDDEWAAPTECPAWSVKGIALHVLGDDLSLLTRQRDGSTDSLTLFAEDHPGLTFRELLDGFNEHWVSGARFLSAPVLIELLDLVGRWSADFYETVGLGTISGEPVQFFATLELSPYWQVIAASTRSGSSTSRRFAGRSYAPISTATSSRPRPRCTRISSPCGRATSHRSRGPGSRSSPVRPDGGRWSGRRRSGR